MRNYDIIRRSSRVVALLIAMAGSQAMAHHSAAAFDNSKHYLFRGTVAKWMWTNPHAWLYVRVDKKDGSQEVWAFVTGGTSMLVRAGWNAADLNVGDKVEVTASPTREPSHIGLLEQVKLPDGRMLSSGFGSAKGITGAKPDAPNAPPPPPPPPEAQPYQ